jgi:hypothetical protein
MKLFTILQSDMLQNEIEKHVLVRKGTGYVQHTFIDPNIGFIWGGAV